MEENKTFCKSFPYFRYSSEFLDNKENAYYIHQTLILHKAFSLKHYYCFSFIFVFEFNIVHEKHREGAKAFISLSQPSEILIITNHFLTLFIQQRQSCAKIHLNSYWDNKNWLDWELIYSLLSLCNIKI